MRNFIYKKVILLALIILIQSFTFGQDLGSSPLVKCWDFPTDNISSFNYAFDHDQIIFPLNDGVIISIDKSGKIIWKSEIGNEITSDIILFNQNVFFLESDSKKTFLHSISGKTGINIWRKELDSTSSDQKLQLSSENNSIILFGVDKKILLIDPNTGNIEEELTTEENISSNFVNTLSNFYYYKKNNGLKILSKDGIKEIANTAKDKKNRLDISQLFNLDKNLLLVSISGQLFLLNKENDQIIWTNRVGGNVSNISENESSIFISSIDNYIYSFAKRNGNINWRKRFETKALSSYSLENKLLVSSLINGNTTFIIETSKGKLINQLSIPADKHFINKPLLTDNKIVLFHTAGVSAYEFKECDKEKE